MESKRQTDRHSVNVCDISQQFATDRKHTKR